MEIKLLQDNHISEIALLCNDVFGKDFITKDYLFFHINSTSKVGIVAIKDNKTIGFLLYEILLIDQLSEIVLKEKDWFVREFKPFSEIKLIKQVAVAKEYQKQGIANILINESLNQQDTSCCLTWRKGDVTSMKNLLLNNGFNFKKTLTNYWKDESLRKNYSCAFCGKPPCKCSAEVYIKKNASGLT